MNQKPQKNQLELFDIHRPQIEAGAIDPCLKTSAKRVQTIESDLMQCVHPYLGVATGTDGKEFVFKKG